MATTERVVDRQITHTSRTYTAGGFLLMLVGVIDTIVGRGLLITSGGISLLGLRGLGVAIACGVVLVFSVIKFAGCASAYRGHNWYGSMTAGRLGLATFFTLPLAPIGTLLIALGDGQFDRGKEMEMRE